MQEVYLKILEITIRRVKYPEWVTFGEIFECEEEYYFYRNDLGMLFVNLASLKPLHNQVLQTVQNAFDFVKGNKIQELKVSDVELPLFLLYHLHQAIPTAEKQKAESPYGELAKNLTAINFLECGHQVPLLMLFDNILRYSGFFQADQNFIPFAVELFLGERAIRSKMQAVSSRCCYNFASLVKRLHKEMAAYAPQIIQGTVAIVQDVEQGRIGAGLIQEEDLRELHAVLSSFLGMKALDAGLKEQVLSLFFLKIDQSLSKSLNPPDPLQTEQSMKQLITLTKSFQAECEPQLKPYFLQILGHLPHVVRHFAHHYFIFEQTLLYL